MRLRRTKRSALVRLRPPPRTYLHVAYRPHASPGGSPANAGKPPGQRRRPVDTRVSCLLLYRFIAFKFHVFLQNLSQRRSLIVSTQF